MTDIPYEQDAWNMLAAGSNHIEAATISIAISLKRIADKLDDVTNYNYDKPAIRVSGD